jgi:ubiquinone/menaquinone biosynthesis C-methylase UbiE
MDHDDHVNLLRKGVSVPGGVWADFGSGQGAFTLALAELLGPAAEIYAIDKDGRSLAQLQKAMRHRFPEVMLLIRTADFATPVLMPSLDGAVMANSLHFMRQKDAALRLVRGYLKPDGRLVLVEYNTDTGNPWVPHPLSYTTWVALAREIGFAHTELLSRRPSRFLGEIYAAASWGNALPAP